MIQYNREYINELLSKFMAGTSTLEEEDILSQYFAQSHIPAEWEQYRLLFAELEAMKPAEKPKRLWLRWSVAAAVVVIALLAIWGSLDSPAEKSLVAENETTKVDSVMPVVTQEEMKTDTTHQQQGKDVRERPKKRSIRKSQPTINDHAKAYALMAKIEQERLEAEQQLEQCQQEVMDAQLAAHGFVPVKQEDGTIVYINEQTNYIAYEE